MSFTPTREQVDEQNATFHKFKQYLDQELGEVRTEVKGIKSNPDLSGEAKQTILRMQEDLQTQSKLIAEQAAEVKALKILQHAPHTGNYDSPEVKESVERKAAFNKLLRWGTRSALTEDERKYIKLDADEGVRTEYKVLFGADGTTGGFLTVPEYVNQLIEAIVLVSDMPSLVDMRMTANPYVMIPKRTRTSIASRVAEQATRNETQNPTFGLVQVFPYESYALTLISRVDLDDSELDLGAFIMKDFATQFAKLQGAEYLNGLGASASQSFGILNDPGITGSGVYTQTASAGTIAYKDLVKLVYSLKSGYRPGATWTFTTETLGLLQAITDTQGRPLWQPFGAVLPNTLFGYPYKEMPDMPQVATGAFSILFGNFKECYTGVVRKQVSIQVLQERYADQNAIGYMGYFRFGGGVKLAEAMKALKIQ